jgi:hypothetical protein
MYVLIIIKPVVAFSTRVLCEVLPRIRLVDSKRGEWARQRFAVLERNTWWADYRCTRAVNFPATTV